LFQNSIYFVSISVGKCRQNYSVCIYWSNCQRNLCRR
jgi:hypothetical protein